MFLGPPLPLPDDLPLSRLITLADNLADVGAWVRCAAREQRLYHTAPGRRCRVLISGDLGVLLRSCGHIALREGNRAVLLDAEVVIHWRVLQVVAATPYLPGLEGLKVRFPEAQFDSAGLSIPVCGWSPEAVLAECLAQGIQVIGSRIVYDPRLTLAAEKGPNPSARSTLR